MGNDSCIYIIGVESSEVWDSGCGSHVATGAL